MIKEIISNKKTVFGNAEAVAYFIDSKDNLLRFIARNSNKWKDNKTCVVFSHDAIGVLLVQAYDYQINRDGKCEFYLDPLNESVITVKPTGQESNFMLENVIIGDITYNYVASQAFASSVHIDINKQAKNKIKARG